MKEREEEVETKRHERKISHNEEKKQKESELRTVGSDKEPLALRVPFRRVIHGGGALSRPEERETVRVGPRGAAARGEGNGDCFQALFNSLSPQTVDQSSTPFNSLSLVWSRARSSAFHNARILGVSRGRGALAQRLEEEGTRAVRWRRALS